MPYSAAAYEARAEQCVKFANSVKDQILQADLLTLRQRYLQRAAESRAADRRGDIGKDRD